MPHQSGLLCRKGRYYLNIRVPTDLRPLYGRREIIRKALGTSDYREAVSRVRYAAFKHDAEFAAKRRQIKSAKPIRLSDGAFSDREAHEMVVRWLVGRERLSEQWWENEGRKLEKDELEEALHGLQIDATVMAGGSEQYEPSDGSFELDTFLQAEGIECPKDSLAYQKLRPLFRRASLENVLRDIDRGCRREARPHSPLFREVFAHTEPQAASPRFTVGDLVDRFMESLTARGRKQVTIRTYGVPCRLLKEVLGENTPLANIKKEDMERLYNLLRKAPSNATKRYPGLKLEQAIAAADRRGDMCRLAGKSLENYFNNIVAIFNFAVGKDLISKNPAKDKYLQATFTTESAPQNKVLFTPEELNLLFHAPLYTGPQTDALKGGAKRPKILRSGKAWLPLLCLFHGFRSNEAAQLYTEDVKTEDGIAFIDVRVEREDGSKSEKLLKTKQSRRRVPIHPEILKMGFLAFVVERSRDPASPRLFPDLPRAATGYYSDTFGKWFAGFVERTIGEDCKATFHSFRHQFRDALREAAVPIDDAERIGGWALMSHSAEREYGKGPSLKRLKQQIQKVKYPGLDLTHLYATKN